MFNDERINKELSRAKKYLGMFFLGFTLFYTILKIIFQTINHSQLSYWLEGVTILASTLFLILHLFSHSSKVKDELYEQESIQYYNKAFKYLSITIIAAYAVLVPITLSSGRAIWTGNRLMSYFIVFAIFFMFLYLRSKNSYLNYNIIEEKNSIFYSRVFKNILKLGLVFLFALVISLFVGIFNINNIYGFLSIILAYIISYISISLFYLLFSFFEKTNYNQEGRKGISTSTIILLVCGLILSIFIASSTYFFKNESAIRYLYHLFYPTEIISLGQFMTLFINWWDGVSQVEFLLLTSGSIYLYYDLISYSQKENIKKLLKISFIILLIYQVIRGFDLYLSPEINSIYTSFDIEKLQILLEYINKSKMIIRLLVYMTLLILATITCNKSHTLFPLALIITILYLLRILLAFYFNLIGHLEILSINYLFELGFYITLIVVILQNHKKKASISSE